MPRPFIFPDPNDRSPNSPSVIVSSTQILGLYNQKNKDDPKERVIKKVQDWFIQEAKDRYMWNEARFSGNQCMLEMTELEKKQIPDDDYEDD